jgi:hypothetical protein
MSMTERGGPSSRPSSEDIQAARPPHRELDETKASFKTTEMWAAIVGVVALIVVYNVSSDLSLDLFRACLLCTVLGAAYIVSRGLAKSGSPQEPDDREERSLRG